MADSSEYPLHGPQVRRPVRVRALQLASVFLALAGLILLYLYSTHREIPRVRVANITPAMNFAYVTMSGEVTREAYLFDSGGVVFDIHDGSGEISVTGGSPQAEQLSRSGKLPRRGDQIEVTGSLSVSAGQEVKLRLLSADHVRLCRQPVIRSVTAPRVKLSEITPSRKGDRVAVIGTLKTITLPRPGSRAPFKLTLVEEGVELDVIFWDHVFRGLEHTLPRPGITLLVQGQIDVYKGALQLKLRNASDLSEVEEKNAMGVPRDGVLTLVGVAQ